jgi:hypothetical protein
MLDATAFERAAMRHGARLLAVMWLLAVIAFGGFFTVIGVASVALGGPERFASWLAFGLVVMAVGLIALGLLWRRTP